MYNPVAMLSDHQKSRLVIWIGMLVVSAVVFCCDFFLRADYSAYGWINALFFTGIMFILGGLLVLVAHYGAFNIFVYGFSDVFARMNPDRNYVKKYDDYVDYTKKKRMERSYSRPYLWPYMVIGGILVAIAGVIRLYMYLKTGF